MIEIDKLIKEAYETAKEKGWHDRPVSFPDYIANIHAELSEAWEEWRNNRGLNEIYYTCERDYECGLYEPHGINQECMGCPKHKPCGIPFELADVVIRICDMCGNLGIDLEQAIELKMAYNRTRSWKHGNKRV
jgi:NTP pyrophosphatase (non-canonical NTP hydrolase)